MNNFYMIGMFQIPQREIQNIELWWLDGNNPEGIKLKFKELKKLSGYNFDNSHLLYSNIYGNLFSIHIHFVEINRVNKSQKWEICIWDEKGSTSIGTIFQPVENKETDRLLDNNYRELSRLTENFSRDIMKCSNCGKEIKKSEIAGRYFAGIYCQHCWDVKYKAIEAQETYN